MKTIEIRIYKIDELEGQALDRALDKMREAVEFEHGHVTEAFHRVLKALGFSGIDCRFSGFGSQGDGASFTAHYEYNVYWRWRSAVHYKDAGLVAIGRELGKLRIHSAEIMASGRYCHSGTMAVEIIEGDPALEDGLLAEARRLADWYYRQVEIDYNRQFSDNVLTESALANEFWFTADGRLWP
jgi:hypothetical protein